jgi:hypothetical protein
LTVIQLTCPSCKRKGNVEISDDAIKNVSRGLLAVNVVLGKLWKVVTGILSINSVGNWYPEELFKLKASY